MPDKDKYSIDVKQAADLLGVSQRTIYRYIKKGDLKAIKKPFGYTEKWFIHEDQIQEKAKLINESVEVKEVNRSISKEELLNAIKEAAAANINTRLENKIDHQEKQIQELKKEVYNLTRSLNKFILETHFKKTDQE